MLVLITYDVKTEDVAGKTRLRKVAKQCVNYGQRVQNSVFEGNITLAQEEKLKKQLKSIIDVQTDKICIYHLSSLKYVKKEEIGRCIPIDDIID